MIGGKTKTYALLGLPVAHSRSPAMHNAWFAHYGIDAVYVALPVDPTAEHLSSALRTLGIAGVNVTIPHKSRIMGALDTLDPIAKAAGAVNTIVRQGDVLHGYNTDAEGFVRAWREVGGTPQQVHAVVLGAGGAGRSVAAGLAANGASSVTLLNRSKRSIAFLSRTWPATSFALKPFTAWVSCSARAELIVNALPAAGRGLVARLDTTQLAATAWWSDLNYWDDAPPGLEAARHRGLRTMTGHRMLLHQGALAFACFTGIEPDPAVVRRVVLPAE